MKSNSIPRVAPKAWKMFRCESEHIETLEMRKEAMDFLAEWML